MDAGRIGRKSLVSTTVYVEGGGDKDTKVLRTACRRAFSELFRNAGLTGRLPKVVACGSRRRAFEDFSHACEGRRDGFPVLLVDSEGPVIDADPWSHLRRQDRWERPRNAPDDTAHMMVQCMESWFYADKESLAGFFGQGFNRNAMSGADIEDIPKADVERGLASATRQSRKGAYQKSRHSFEILLRLDVDKICDASPHAKRLIETLLAKSTGDESI